MPTFPIWVWQTTGLLRNTNLIPSVLTLSTDVMYAVGPVTSTCTANRNVIYAVGIQDTWFDWSVQHFILFQYDAPLQNKYI